MFVGIFVSGAWKNVELRAEVSSKVFVSPTNVAQDTEAMRGLGGIVSPVGRSGRLVDALSMSIPL